MKAMLFLSKVQIFAFFLQWAQVVRIYTTESPSMYLVYQLPPSAAAAAGRRAPVFCASGRAVGGRPLDAERRRERLRLAAQVRPVAAEGVRRAGPPRQRPRPAEAVPDARDGREPDVLQLDDLLLLGESEGAIRRVCCELSQGPLVKYLIFSHFVVFV